MKRTSVLLLLSLGFLMTKWTWATNPFPAGVSDLLYLTAINYPELLGPQRIYVFAVDANFYGEAYRGHLVVNYCDGFNWY